MTKTAPAPGFQLLSLSAWLPPFDQLAARVRLDLYPDSEEDLRRLVSAAGRLARPRAVWSQADSVIVQGDRVVIDGIEFLGGMLASKLAESPAAWPYLASCGPELEALDSQADVSELVHELLGAFWLDHIKALALDAAFTALRESVLASCGNSRLCSMNPGSGSETLWPLEQQRPLFRLLGSAATEAAGVRLNDSCLMRPNKSLSGIFFLSPSGFESCSYCGRADCPDRRAPSALEHPVV